MELKLSLLLVELLMILCFLSLQALAGLLSSPSLSSASSFIFPIKVKAESDLELSEITHRFLLLENDRSHSPTSAETNSKQQEHDTVPESIHYHQTNHAQSPSHHPSPKGLNPRKRDIPSIPQIPSDPSKNRVRGTSPSSPVSMHKNYHHNGQKAHHIAPEPSHHHSFSRKGSKGWNPKGSLPFPAIPYNHINVPSPSPSPTNQGCSSLKCTEPLTYTPHGSPCGCVLPIEVSLRFSISLYNFFPLVPELSREIAKGISLNRSQVRILGADAADHQQEKTTALINLVPLDDKFDADTAFSIYRKFWMREVLVKTSVFGAYEVLYVHYTGLPPSPPSRPETSAAIDAQPYSEGNNGDGPLKPIGVDLTRKRKNSSDKNIVLIVVLSSVTAFVVIVGFIVLSLSKSGYFSSVHEKNRQNLMNSDNKQSGGRFLTLRSKPSSGSISFSSSLVAFAGSAKIFPVHEIERATDRFSASRVLGEGGFGIVYGGVLEDGSNVAVKVLKRDNRQGSREFLAEVEMLSRLHHRNLVKLIGICAEEHLRCLVYELVPNGSVESHLHGADKESAPLDWPSRMKIALGAARGLAYLHEDSSPRVIHRDFKSSNILLEHDYTPKVSDFGLARTAMEDENKHISTHVMGTFGYLAPEYAMTGHLLVKSDVYSYGVVLLELLTGRKPVDLTQPPGQENLVLWARPLLTAREGLEALIDPAIKPHVPLESFTRVATIASMLVQPEVSHRPFMGEVVQALKLVCNEIEDASRSLSRDEMFSVDAESKHSRITNELLEDLEREECMFEEARITVSDVDLKGGSDVAIRGRGSESFRREFNSAPLKVERKRMFWQRLRRFSRGSMSEHEYLTRL